MRGRNSLIAGARNDGMKKARGEYIAHLDDDEVWFENKLEVCLNALKNNRDYLFAYHKSYKRKLGDSTLEEWLPDWDKDYLFNVSNIIPSSNVVIKKELFDKYGGFSEDIRIYPRCDWEYWARLTQYTEFLFIPQFLGIYQEHQDSIVAKEKMENSTLTKEHNEFIRIYIHKYREQDTCTIVRDKMEMQRKLDELWLRVKFQWEEIEKNKNLITGLVEKDSNIEGKIEQLHSQIMNQEGQIMNQEGQIKKLDDKLTSALYKLNDMYTSRLFQIYRWLQRISGKRKD